MAIEKSHSQEFDLDRTDKLPILKGTMFDPEVADDATPMSAEDARGQRAKRLDYEADISEDTARSPRSRPNLPR